MGVILLFFYGVTIGLTEHNYHLLSCHPFIYNEFYGIVKNKMKLVMINLIIRVLIGNDVWIGCNSTFCVAKMSVMAQLQELIRLSNTMFHHIDVENPAKLFVINFMKRL